MKELIESTGLTPMQFSKRFEIPYNTIRQYYNGERIPPKWVKNLLKYKIENITKGEQIKIEI